MDFNTYQQKVDDWIKLYGVRYFDEMTNTLLLMEEMGELARLMARKYGEQSFKKKSDEKAASEKIEDEMADIVFVLSCLANQMNINLNDILLKNLNKKSKRDHQRHHKNKKLH